MAYLINVGFQDIPRANAMNKIFDCKSIEFFPFDSLKQGDRALFVGCGNGILVVEIASRLQSKGVLITAIDISEEQIQLAKMHAQSRQVENITWKVQDIHNLSEYKSSFKLVHARFVLNHLQRPDQVTRILCDTLGDDGIFVSEDFDRHQVKIEGGTEEEIEAIRAWEQAVVLQHMAQKSNIAFASALPSILQNCEMTKIKQEQPCPLADTADKLSMFVESLSNAPKFLAKPYLAALPELERIFSAMNKNPILTVCFEGFTHTKAQRRILSPWSFMN